MGKYKNTLYVYSKFLKSLRYAFHRDKVGFVNAQLSNASVAIEYMYKQKFLFIHINKTGGSSIEKALNMRQQVHYTASMLKYLLGTDEYEKKYTFTFVRNPFDKVVSQYAYRLKNDQTGIKKKNIGFKEWVNLTYVDRNPLYYNIPEMFMPQYHWLHDYSGKLLVDFVGKFETLEKDFNEVINTLDLNAILPHVRKSHRKPYPEYYDLETKEIITNHYRKDLETFGYKF